MFTGKYGDPCVERHTALIYDRGGLQRLSQVLDLNEIEWSRYEDDKSAASFIVTGRSCRAQTSVLKAIEPRRHELVLYRGSERVWEGPVVNTDSTASTFRLDAHDVLEYVDFTALSKRWPGPDGGGPSLMTERLRAILTYELTTNYNITVNAVNVAITAWENLATPANILPFLDIRLGTTLTSSETGAFEMTVGEHLYNLGRSIGVSYTTIGRSIVIWDGVLGRTRTVTEKDFSGDFHVIAAGSDFFTVSHVVATDGYAGDDPAVGHAVNDMSYYGPWEKVTGTQTEDASSSPDPAELNSQARRSLASNYPLPLELIAADGSSLIPSKGLGINDLVAGVEIPVRAQHNLRPVAQMQRLKSLKVKEIAAGESISGTLEAVGGIGVVA